MRSWIDLKHRVAHDRRCFTLMHPAVPNLPLVVLHVALTSKISDSVDDLIRRRDVGVGRREGLTAAVFYSITSTQDGLRVRFCCMRFMYLILIVYRLFFT